MDERWLHEWLKEHDAQPEFLLLNEIQLAYFGKYVVLRISYSEAATTLLRIEFQNCQEFRAEFYGDEEEPVDFKVAEIIGANLGEDQYRRRAFVTTDLCEFSVLYESILIELEPAATIQLAR